ncbi:MAG: PAS domain S-box protein [Anaerolineae bacterium]
MALDAMCILDRAGNIVCSNPAFQQALGYTGEELRGLFCGDVMHPDDRDATCEGLLKLQLKEQVSAYELRLITKDQVIKWFSWSVVVNADVIYCVGRDISQTKAEERAREVVEEALRAYNDQLLYEITERQKAENERDRLFNVSVDMMCILSIDGRFRRVNPVFIENMGYTLEELKDKTIFDLADPDDRDMEEEVTQTHPGSRPIIRFTRRYFTKSGRRRWLAWSVVLDDGAFYCVARDVTRSKAQEAELEASNTQLRQQIAERERLEYERDQLYAITPDLIATLDADKRFIRVNPAFMRILKVEERALVGTSFLNIIYPEDLPQAEAAFGELTEAVSKTFKVNAQVTGGDKRCIDWVITRADDLFFAVGRDVTEAERLEEIRHELQIQEAVMRLKQNFVAQVSHEMRTPLTVILSSNEMMRNYFDRLTDERRMQHLDKIEFQVKHMIDMIDDLLLIDRLGNSQLDLQLEVIDFARLSESLVQEFTPLLKPNQHLHIEQHGDLQTIRIDPRLLNYILTNLLSNAIKFSPDGSAIEIHAETRDGQFIVRVRDEGIGIHPKDQRHIFEPFRRARNNPAVSSTGLGLAIVKSSVEKHGGTLDLQSDVNKGTTFTVRIPQL